jgi:hypothetical protein
MSWLNVLLAHPPWFFYAFGLLDLVFGLPLALGMVPMNRWYGIRIPRAYRSEENWYAINRTGGWWMVVGALLTLFAGTFVGDLSLVPPYDSLILAGPSAIVGLCLLAAMAQASRID